MHSARSLPFLAGDARCTLIPTGRPHTHARRRFRGTTRSRWSWTRWTRSIARRRRRCWATGPSWRRSWPFCRRTLRACVRCCAPSLLVREHGRGKTPSLNRSLWDVCQEGARCPVQANSRTCCAQTVSVLGLASWFVAWALAHGRVARERLPRGVRDETGLPRRPEPSIVSPNHQCVLWGVLTHEPHLVAAAAW